MNDFPRAVDHLLDSSSAIKRIPHPTPLALTVRLITKPCLRVEAQPPLKIKKKLDGIRTPDLGGSNVVMGYIYVLVWFSFRTNTE